MEKNIPFEIIEIIYRFCDIETKLSVAKNYYDLRPLKINYSQKYDNIIFALKVKKFKINYNIVIFELKNRYLFL